MSFIKTSLYEKYFDSHFYLSCILTSNDKELVQIKELTFIYVFFHVLLNMVSFIVTMTARKFRFIKKDLSVT